MTLTDRMVIYANNADTVEFDITVPLTRIVTQPSDDGGLGISTFASQFSQVRFKRYESIRYYDGI